MNDFYEIMDHPADDGFKNSFSLSINDFRLKERTSSVSVTFDAKFGDDKLFS